MSHRLSVEDAASFAFAQMQGADIKGVHKLALNGELMVERHSVRIDPSTRKAGSVTLCVERSFRVKASLVVSFRPEPSPEGDCWVPEVGVSYAAGNAGIMTAVAQIALLQELTALGARIQEQLDEYEIPMVTGT